ncbi:MAG: hypothetical protein DMD89_04080 [Candidatus Rokuibacteriota bacterium]|nr:MAG: hypothetical protein DMD89_04080 [Candidatus Rokubacteria bacterium]
MNRKANVLVVLAVFTLVCVLANDEAAAQAITVTPANPTISVGQTQRFTATGVGAATAVDLGAFYSCALLQDGTVRCWGQNDLGQLGDGTTTNASTPVAVAGIGGAAALTAGGFHTCVRFPDGTIQCWGRNNAGQLGDPGTTAFQSPTPVRVAGLTATAVTAGGFHTCALPGDGTVRCWGQNDLGQLGNGTSDPVPNNPSTFNPTPVTVSGITTAVAISAGGWYTCALLQDGTVRCWGDNTYGELGNGAAVLSPSPSNPVTPTPTPVTVSGITTAVAIEAGVFHMCAILRDGTLQCWGRGEEGRLGNGSTANSSTPVTVSGIAPAAIAPGAEHSCAVLRDGTMRCWGDNNFGQLGNGSPQGSFSTTPSGPVTGITTAIGASSGAEHTCALLQDGSLRCWGRNVDGRIGNGTTTDAFTPVAVTGFGGVTWTSSDPTVATIDANGLATGRAAGTTTITAASGSRSGSTTLTVASGTPVTRSTLSVVREGTGSGAVASSPAGISCGATCSAAYDNGTVVTLTATPANGSTFEGWTGGGCTGTGTCTLTLTANTTVFARFGVSSSVTRFTLSVTREGSSSGTVTSSPAGIDCGTACAATYDSGTVVTLTATPAANATFDGWTGGGCSGTGPCTLTLTADTTVTARFNVRRVTLSVSRQGTGGGTVTSSPAGIDCGTACAATYDSGSVVTLTATPAANATFDGWTGGGCAGTGPCTLTLTANTTVTARFSVRRFTLSVTLEGLGGGTVTSSPAGINCGTACATTYDSGTVVTLTARPDSLSTFGGWRGGGCSGTGPCTVTLTGNTTVSADFRLLGLF